MSARSARVFLWAALWLAGPVSGTDRVWLIGGGSDPQNSQAQIELNVLWARQVLLDAPGERHIRVFFNDGDDPGRDLQVRVAVPEAPASLQPLARVFDSYVANAEELRNHRIPGVAGGTDASSLHAELAQEFRAVQPGDRVLLVYNGHGVLDPADPAGNALLLWNNTRLTVRQLDALLAEIPAAVPVRFVLTQCFAGGFARLMRPAARNVAALGDANRCGFMAEAADQPAEGCSAGIDTGDYRDYSTFFFAALGGRTRRGQPLSVDPDTDGDDRVTLYEAHLHALRVARSSDLPRSTSEVYLEEWQPWYLRWFGWASQRENRYTRLADDVAQDVGVTGTGRQRARSIAHQRRTLEAEKTRLRKEQRFLRTHIGELRGGLQADVLYHWPGARYAYTLAFKRFLEEDLDAAQRYILAHPDYSALAKSQARYWGIDDTLLSLDRQLRQLDKVERLARLGRILSQFERHASAAEKADYGRLLACERSAL